MKSVEGTSDVSVKTKDKNGTEFDELGDNEEKFVAAVGALVQRGLDFHRKVERNTRVVAPENPFLLNNWGVVDLIYGPETYKLTDLFRTYLHVRSARDAVSALYQILYTLRCSKNKVVEYSSKIRALEYAIWDAEYRLHEHIVNFINKAKLFSSHQDIKKIAAVYIDVLSNIFKERKKRRGINTHQYQIDVKVIEDVSTLGLLVENAFKEPGDLWAREFMTSDIKRKVREFRLSKRQEEERFLKLSGELVEMYVGFAFKYCDIGSAFKRAMAEEIKLK